MNQPKTDQERFETLESLTMHLQNDVEQLNEVILKQQSEIQQMQAHVARLENRVDEQVDSEPSSQLEDDRPPHY